MADGALPPPVVSVSYETKAQAALRNIYLNDQLGDCVIAGGYHVVGVETGNATGTPFVATDQQIIADYGAVGGYVPGDPSTDQGCNIQTALAHWQTVGFADGTKLKGYLSVNPTNKHELMTALYLFENLVFGLELPDAYVNPFPSGDGFTWGVAGAPDPSNGHCIIGAGYNTSGVGIDTWALEGTFTWEAIAAYCTASNGGEVYTVITPDQLAKGQSVAPNGFNWLTLTQDFDILGGHVAVVPKPRR